MGLKEPLLLNDMVGWRRRGASARDVAEATDHALTLLAKPFGDGEAVIIKPSNIVNGMIRLIMALRPNANALLLYAPLPVFLTSVAKKGLDGRLWVRELFIGFRKDGLAERLGFDDEALFGQTDLQIAAAGWLAQQALFAELIDALGIRVRSLDSETLLDRPADAVGALGRLYGLSLDRDEVAEIVAGPFRRNSKTGEAFAHADRQTEYAEAATIHRDELEKVTRWAEAVAKAADIPLPIARGAARLILSAAQKKGGFPENPPFLCSAPARLRSACGRLRETYGPAHQGRREGIAAVELTSFRFLHRSAGASCRTGSRLSRVSVRLSPTPIRVARSK